VILLRNLTLARAGRPLLEGVNLSLHAGWKAGVTGANGTGKSSLFALLRGELHQEQGRPRPAAELGDRPRRPGDAGARQSAPSTSRSTATPSCAAIERRSRAAEAAHDGEA
jgi:ATP-binding cassette subfamily F protein 3